MCQGCYENYGSPAIISDTVIEAAKLIEEVYSFDAVGGNLHIAVDDWNLDDESLEWLELDWMPEHQHDTDPEQFDAETRCLAALKSLSVPERASAMALQREFIK